MYLYVYILGGLMRAQLTRAQGGSQGSGPQGPKVADKGHAHRCPRGPTRARPARAQGGPQGPGPGPQEPRGARKGPGSHKRPAHKGPAREAQGGPQGRRWARKGASY